MLSSAILNSILQKIILIFIDIRKCQLNIIKDTINILEYIFFSVFLSVYTDDRRDVPRNLSLNRPRHNAVKPSN